MQFKISAVALALVTLAAATPARRWNEIPASQCTGSTGSLECCNSVTTAGDPSLTNIFGLLGIVVQDVTAIVGVTCSPISVIGVGGNSCTAQPVCCTNNSFNGIVALGCTPVNINL